MIDPLPKIAVPGWLESAAINKYPDQIPLPEILKDSLYYPACGLNGTPVKFLGGNILSFVYADYLIKRHQLLANLHGDGPDDGFSGYSCACQRDVERHEVAPLNWHPPMIPRDPNSQRKAAAWQAQAQPFGHWSIWRKNADADHNGPELFSFFYLGGEMNAVYQGLYTRLGLRPLVLAVIQPGAFGGEWESVTSEGSFFRKVVKANPAGMPEYLLYGGYGGGGYNHPCWNAYAGDRIARLPERCAGLWRLNEGGA